VSIFLCAIHKSTAPFLDKLRRWMSPLALLLLYHWRSSSQEQSKDIRNVLHDAPHELTRLVHFLDSLHCTLSYVRDQSRAIILGLSSTWVARKHSRGRYRIATRMSRRWTPSSKKSEDLSTPRIGCNDHGLRRKWYHKRTKYWTLSPSFGTPRQGCRLAIMSNTWQLQ